LISPSDFERLSNLLERRRALLNALDSTNLVPNPTTLERLVALGTAPITKPVSASDLLRREEITCTDLAQFGIEIDQDEEVFSAVEFT